jgi:uncharacterized membrane protein YgdD (TMEM256/DUF423 family)
MNTAFRISAVVGFLAVALGAFGAHSLHDVLVKNDRLATWETAVLYHLSHAAVMLVVASLQPFRRIGWWLFFAGVLLFSGSLYVLSLTNLRWLGAIAPFGGGALLAGWLALVICRAKADSQPDS